LPVEADKPDTITLNTNPAIPIIMRARNDMPLIKETLEMIGRQSIPYELIAFDNDSQDGTKELLEQHAQRVCRVPAGKYIPGRVLNEAMRSVDPKAPFVVFLNSDCKPADSFWLENLIKGFDDDKIGAVFGRQLPRPDCLPLFLKDTEDTFGDGIRQQYWKHCFSMASSAIRRSVWEELQFSETLQYSEDIDWTWRIRQMGWTVKYQQFSQVYHSHNYTRKQFAKRHRGEGKAEAIIFSWSRWESTLLRYSLLPFLRQIKSDLLYALEHKEMRMLLSSPGLRFSQMIGRRKGFKEGLKSRNI
jgi:rhamnosyltransferase